MPLRHPAVALAKAKGLSHFTNTPSVHKAHSEVRTVRSKGGPIDRPTDKQKRFRKHAEWFRSMLSPCQKKSYSHDMQNKAVQNFPKQVQVLPLPAGNLGRSHKSTPPLDRRFPDPGLSSFRRQRYRQSPVRMFLSLRVQKQRRS